MLNQLIIPVFLCCFFVLPLSPLPAAAADNSYLSDLRKFAEAGDSESQFALALLYEYGGEGIVRNQKEALIMFEKAGRAEIAGACLYLGIKYENGNGVEQDYGKAAGWYDCAVRQDWPAAQFFLARLYREGKGVKQDNGIALALLGLAVEHGYPGSEKEYAELLEKFDSMDFNALKEKQKSLLQSKTH